MSDGNRLVALAIGVLGMGEGVLLTPPVFSRVFAMAPLLPGEEVALWWSSGILLAVSALLAARRSSVKPEVVAIFLSGLMLVGIELTARLTVQLVTPSAKVELTRLAYRTYPDARAYRGHPFVQFTGNPSVTVIGGRLLGEHTRFNNHGIRGADTSYAKPAGVIRVAALGGSTTVGYPPMLERFLNQHSTDRSQTFEVLNFGMAWHNSAHNLVKFILTVVEFEPDFVVLHHGWNDRYVRNTPPELFRADYSHALRSFRPPRVIDKIPIRISIIYRFLKQRLTGEPDWANLSAATAILDRPKTEQEWQDARELRPFRRNTEMILQLAALRGITVVLATQPRTTDTCKAKFNEAPHLDAANEIVRELAGEHGQVILVDLDRSMTGKNELFIDLAHVSREGKLEKAERIGLAILAAIAPAP